ncbi:hypothetical protein NE237_031287 [Protea cynaroides]|uniref:Histidinol dehydrogenase n=1 Tax=Protea cynaroides TaxID=273540 RepID=A0A9Q0L1B3_9MAGN|nr:hypothetical protein NE237_031287 [Protea cynaroides]
MVQEEQLFDWFKRNDGAVSRSKCKIKCMKAYRLSELSRTEVDSLKARPHIDFSKIFNVVHPIVEDVRSRGDVAVIDYTTRFDKVELDKIVECVPDLPNPELDPAVREAFDVAYDNIHAFLLLKRLQRWKVLDAKGYQGACFCGSLCSRGHCSFTFYSSDAFSACTDCWLQNCCSCNSPRPRWKHLQEVLIVLRKLVLLIYLKLGELRPFQPWHGNCILPQGPSEVLVIADKHANPVHIAADLLSQAEHDPDSQVVLVIAGDNVDMEAIEKEISRQCESLPRGDFASKALSHSFTVFARDMVEVISFSNLYAPEHLIINVKDAEKWEGFIQNAELEKNFHYALKPIGRRTSPC